MSMLKYPLSDFIATVAICCQTTTLAAVLDILDLEQCDRLLVVSELQSPIGLLYSARLIPQLMAVNHQDAAAEICLDQAISALGLDLIEPIMALPADLSLEQFSLYLSSQSQKSNNCHYALVDATGKFVGLLDSSRVLQFLAKRSPSRGKKHPPAIAHQRQRCVAKPKALALGVSASSPRDIASKSGLKALVQLLELLPWPLMLETATGEIVTQNTAWWQQLGSLNDPEGVRQEVKSLLSINETENIENSSDATQKFHNVSKKEHITKPRINAHLAYEAHPHSLTSPVEGEQKRSNRRKKTVPLPSNSQIDDDIATLTNRCFIGTEPDSCTCVLEVQDGQERVWQFVKILLDSPELQTSIAAKTDIWLVLATDVTEQQQLCKELVAKNADLVQLNRLKDEFLACISHELKTPLTAVLGLSSLLKDQLLGELNERQARYAGLIHQSGRHLMTVVNDILDLTRMETGQMELTLGPVTIRNACDRALSDAKSIQAGTSKASAAAQSQPKEESHKFTLSIESGLDRITADDLRLRQMLAHLLSNALKFTETGGEIGLCVSRWEGWVAFTVWDTGIGIPEQKQHLIFQKFQQLENPLTRQFEGTGLGLVLTRALARMHGGDVTFLSKEGEGSQFTLLLPPSPPSEFRSTDPESGTPKSEPLMAERQPKTKSQNPKQNNRLILVVEAVARDIDELTEKLTGLGYRVVIARSGCEALEKARRLQPGAVFLNPVLPLLSGWDVLTLLKSDSQTRQIPVIVMGTRAEKEHAVVNRADGFIGLPVQEEILQPLLARLFQTPPSNKIGSHKASITPTTKPLTILHLVNPGQDSNSYPSLLNHRILEADDLEQAELLARVWHLDVVLLSEAIPNPEAFLQKLSQHPRLASLPLVTCDITTTQAASGLTKLSVFPCLIPSSNSSDRIGKTDTLLSVLQIAAGRGCPPTISVIDLGQLSDPHNVHSKGSEWFQALLQYLQTAGYKATMSRSCQEVLQQIHHKSVDLLIICLGESTIHPQVHAALTALKQMGDDLPPVLVLDQRLSLGEVRSSFHQRLPHYSQKKGEDNSLPLLPTAEYYDETVLGAIATQILPPSISMEELLAHIHTALSESEVIE